MTQTSSQRRLESNERTNAKLDTIIVDLQHTRETMIGGIAEIKTQLSDALRRIEDIEDQNRDQQKEINKVNTKMAYAAGFGAALGSGITFLSGIILK